MPRTTSSRAQKRSGSESAVAETVGAREPARPLTRSGAVEDAELADLFAPLDPFSLLILAVSGGADSVAMMHLVARWAELAPSASRTIVVATVDHGLRAESAREAAWVAREAKTLGLPHETLVWRGPKPSSALQEAAREARYGLLAELGWRYGGQSPAAVVTAHTEDDQAETLLMRLVRGSGLDGLAGMSQSRLVHAGGGCQLVRPLLGVGRVRLEATLRERGLGWLEDPSNACDRFERVRLRKARGQLAALGLTNEKIALSARRLERARIALETASSELQSAARLDVHGGMYASLDARVFACAAQELRLRVMTRLVAAFGGQSLPVRLARLETLVARMSTPAFEAATLGGCIVTRKGGAICVYREPERVSLEQLELAPGGVAVWDRRFRVTASEGLDAPVVVRALGAPGYAALRRRLEVDAGMAHALPPARAGAALPSFWQGQALLDVPPISALPGAPQIAPKGRHCSAEFLW